MGEYFLSIVFLFYSNASSFEGENQNLGFEFDEITLIP